MSLNAKQIEAIELFALGRKNCGQVAKEIDVHPNTITAWRRDKEFTSELVRRARELLYDALPEVYKALKVHAKKGKIHHIRTILEHIDNLEKVNQANRSGNISFSWNTPDAPAH